VGQVLGTSGPTTIELNLRIRNSALTEFAFTPKRHMLLSYNHLPHLDHPERLASCGAPIGNLQVKLLDDDGHEVADGEVGEICCRGPQTMAYYWNKPEATAQAFRNGWLHTGDIGRMDEDGYFYILDRKNDMLISGGYNVYPREVEDVLLEVEGVDLQPCGGTHVTNTAEVGDVVVTKIEKKSAMTRRVVLGFGPAPTPNSRAVYQRTWAESQSSPY
jgi:acyl-CoA synthetase (AMP-forming)/AMP-acid ligase II